MQVLCRCAIVAVWDAVASLMLGEERGERHGCLVNERYFPDWKPHCVGLSSCTVVIGEGFSRLAMTLQSR